MSVVPYHDKVFSVLGANNHSDNIREKDDFYATNPKTLELLLDKLESDNYALNKNVWECAVGAGHLADVLKKRGYNVHGSDLIDRGYPNTEILDFMRATERPFNSLCIITNPPYKMAEKFVAKALSLLKDGEQLVFILKVQFLEGQSRYDLYQANPPKYVYVHSTRQACAMNGEFIKDGKEIGSAVCYCWYIWEKGYKGDTIVRWIR